MAHSTLEAHAHSTPRLHRVLSAQRLTGSRAAAAQEIVPGLMERDMAPQPVVYVYVCPLSLSLSVQATMTCISLSLYLSLCNI